MALTILSVRVLRQLRCELHASCAQRVVTCSSSRATYVYLAGHNAGLWTTRRLGQDSDMPSVCHCTSVIQLWRTASPARRPCDSASAAAVEMIEPGPGPEQGRNG